MTRKSTRFLAAFVVAFVSISSFAANDIFTWVGGASGNWNESANWLCNGAATERWPGEGTSTPNNSDEAHFNGVTATVTLNGGPGYVKVLMVTNHADVTIQSDSTKRTLNVYAPGIKIYDSNLTMNGANLMHSTSTSQWSCGGAVTFNGDSLLTLSGSTFYNGRVSANTCFKVRALNGSTFWFRYADSLPSFDYYIENSTINGRESDSCWKSIGNSKVTFAGTTPKMTFHTKPTQVTDTLTLRYILPAGPYAKPPMQADNVADFYNDSGYVKIEIDPDSPGLTSGSLQAYRLIGCDKDLLHGIVLDNFIYPTMRTSSEVFTSVWKEGAEHTVPPQYLELTVDGAFDPNNAPMEASFTAPASFRPNMRFGGNVSAMGVVAGTTATSVALKLEYGSDNTLGNEVVLGNITSTGDFAFDFSGFDATSTYYYRLTLENDLGQTVVSDIGTCSHICGTQLDSAVSATMVNGRGTASGSVYVIGAGTTTVKLMIGRNELEMFEHGSVVVDSTGPFAIDIIYPDEGKWYYKFVSENSYESQHWEWESGVSFVEVSDSNTYTWKGGDGDFYDMSKWTCAVENSGIGFPTSASTVVFPSNTTGVVQITNSVKYANVTFLQNDSSYTFVGNGSSFGMYHSSSGGRDAYLKLDNVKFYDPTYIWSGLATISAGNGSNIDLVNGAEISYKYVNINGTNSVLYIGAGSKCEQSLGGLYGQDAQVVVSNGFFSTGNAITLNGRKVTFLGDSPRTSLTRNTCSGVTFDIDLPAEPYAGALIDGATTQGDFAGSAVTTINILKSEAARRNGGTYRIISYGIKSEAAKDANCINTNNVVITGLKSGDSYAWSWADGEAYAALGPQYLDITIAKQTKGLMIFLK